MSVAACPIFALGSLQAPGARDANRPTRPKVSDSSHDDRSDEEALISAAQGGDTGAMRELYRRHAPTVYRCAIAPLVSDRALGEDLLADTFVRAMENLGKFRWQGRGLLPWLIRIAKNLTLDHLRRCGRISAWPEGLEPALCNDSYDSEAATSEAQLRTLLQSRIEVCIGALNPRYANVLQLRLVDGLSREAAAVQLQISVGTLDVLLFRACRAFRRVYVERFGEAPQVEFGAR